jgi:hypothetical protein
MALKMGEHPQVVRRQFWQMEDQHGRTWGGNFDMRVQPNPGCVEAGLKPDHWRAPLVVPPQYQAVKWEPRRGPRMEIDYPRWIENQQTAIKVAKAALNKLGHARYGDAYNPERPSPALLSEFGTMPAPVEPILAAQAGDPWVLGLKQPNGAAYPMPAWARPYFASETKDPLAFMRTQKPTKAEPKPAAKKPTGTKSRDRLSSWQQFLKDNPGLDFKEASALYRQQKQSA